MQMLPCSGVSLEQIFPGESELARRMRGFEWNVAPVGEPAAWPHPLRSTLAICLASPFPMLVCWGRDTHTMFYNDAAAALLGRGHPVALGRPVRQAWPGFWEAAGAAVERVFREGRAECLPDVGLQIERALPNEEAFFTLSFVPIAGDGEQVDGLCCTCIDTTEKVVGRRRLETLQRLGAAALQGGAVEACRALADALARDPCDVPFTAVYLSDEAGGTACLAACAGLADDGAALPRTLGPPALPLADALKASGPTELAGLERIGFAPAGGGTVRALGLPLRTAAGQQPAGLLVAGIGAGRPLDVACRQFLELAASHLSLAIGAACLRGVAAANRKLQHEAEERKASEAALRDRESRLALKLFEMRQLQHISSQLNFEENVSVLCAQILDAAIALMEADTGSIQIFAPERKELQLLAWRGFRPESAAFWQRVDLDSNGSCGEAMRRGGRVIVPDVFTCDFMAGTEDLEHFRLSDIRAMQSTPLVARSGRFVGMISTHWRGKHQPPERKLLLLDVLARQAADLLEHMKVTEALREGRAQQVFLLRLSDELRVLDDALQITSAACRLLGEHLRVHRVVYADIDGDNFIIRPGYAHGVAPLPLGVRPAASLGRSLVDAYLNGKRIVVQDVESDTVLTAEDREVYLHAGIAALTCAVIMKSEQRVGVLAIHSAVARDWQDAELQLIHEVADRIFAAVERSRALEALRESEQRLRIAIGASHMFAWEIDLASETCKWSESNRDMIGVPVPRTLAAMRELLHPDDLPELTRLFNEAVAAGGEFKIEHRVVSPRGGAPLWMFSAGVALCDGDAAPRRVLGITQNITERKEAEQQIKRSREEFKRLAENSPDVIARMDRDLRVRYVSPAIEKLTGVAPRRLLNRHAGEFDLPPETRDRWIETMRRVFETGEQAGLQFEFQDRSGTWRFFDAVIVPERGADGRVEALLGIARDVTVLKQGEARLQFLATHDALTALPNRALLQERLQLSLTRSQRAGNGTALLYVDLDHFKPVNDSLGHEVGDELLQAVSSRVSECIRKSDTLARIGGDEFAVLLDDIRDPQEAGWIAGNVINALSRPFHLAGQHIYISASVGIACAPADGKTADTLLRHADAAMYKAKEEGKNDYRFFSKGMDSVARDKLFMSASLRGALERDELALVYQPCIDTRSDRIVGVEALIRWHSPARGLVLPSRFVGLAEEIGMIEPIGEWALRAACEQLVRWGMLDPAAFRVAVNISARHFRQPKLAERIARILRETGVNPASLELEITESVVMANPEKAKQTLRQLADLGVKLALDDFGTGHSSLAYLQRFPVHRLKIDQSFVRNLPEHKESGDLARAIIAMAKSLGLEVTAEGVEREGQRKFLQQAGCDTWQGYLFSVPVRADALTTMLA